MNGYKKVGVISEETAYAQGLMTAYTKAATALGLEVLNENFLTGSEDFRATLLKLKQKGVSALFFNSQAEPGIVVLYKQLRDLDWNVPVYGTFMPGSPVFLGVFGKKADGIIYAFLAFNDTIFTPAAVK